MLSADSTPNISHIDQLSVTVRYGLDDKPIKRFLQFVSIFRHSGQTLYNVVLKFFAEKRIPLGIVVDSPTTTRPTCQENIMVDKPN